MRKYVCILLCIILGNTFTWAQNQQDQTSKFKFKTTLTNQLIWRSRRTTKAPTIIPSVEYHTKGLVLGVWAAYSTNNSYKEIDFYANYKWKKLVLSIFDYYNPAIDTKVGFGNFKQGKSEHLLEAVITYKPLKSNNLKLTGALMFAGNDWKITPPSLEQNNTKIEQRYSSYFEVAYEFHIGTVILTPEIGLTPFKGVYANDFKVFNYSINAAKKVKVSERISLPTSYKLAYNAQNQAVYFSVSVSL